MKYKNLREDMIVTDKVTRKDFRVIKKTPTEAMLEEVENVELPFPQDTAATAVMTPENAICFQFKHDPNPFDIPDGEFGVQDGILTQDGEPATEEQGEMEVLKVLGKIRAAVLMIAKAEVETDLVDIVSYEPFHDRFNRIMRGLNAETEVRFVTAFENYGILTMLEKKNVLYKTNADGSVEEYRDAATYYGMLAVDRRRIVDTGNLAFEADPEDIHVMDGFLFAGGNILTLEEHNDYHFIDGNRYGYLVFDKEDGFRRNAVLMDGKASITKSLKYGFVLKTENFLKLPKTGLELKTSKLAATMNYPYLVDITSRGEVTFFVFADKNRAIKVLKKTATKDRGNIYTVEDTFG